jgi:cobalt-precorrin 5A hydrolase
MRIAVLTLSREGTLIAKRLAENIDGVDVFVHTCVDGHDDVRRFTSIAELTGEIFHEYKGFVYVAPCGVVVRSIAAHLKNKYEDPAVVVVDVYGRWSISLLSGHEGGANDLALQVANVIAAEPIVTTSTEALKDIIVGVGCRRGTEKQNIVTAVNSALGSANLGIEAVRLIASADIKSDEAGLIAAAQELGVPLKFISSNEIRECAYEFRKSDFVQEQVDLPAVAEPAALLAGRRTRLLLPKTSFGGITVAIAKESFIS